MKISIIVPAYNEEKYIEDTLKSIRAQKTNLKYELIVSDSKSTDKTVEIAKKYADKIVSSPKRDIAATRNAGASIAKGNIFVFIDSDTTISSDYLEFMIKRFEKTPHLIGASTGFKFSKQTPKIKFAEEVVNSYFVMLSQIDKTVLFGFNTCVLRSKFEKVGGYKSVLLEDGRLSKELNLIGKIEFVPDKKVTTSSRRLEKMGVLGALRYYFDFFVAESDIDFPFESVNTIKKKAIEKATKHKDRKNIR